MDDGIIFGQRGQGLLTSGRGAIFGQQGALDPIVQAYDDILATDPTVPVLLQLTEYRGQQILFQDPECTIPVESPGDPIGGVRHPITGEIIAVQETDASRPVWGGVSVGADLSGAGFLEHVQDPSTWIDFAHQTGVFTIWTTVFFDSDDGNQAEDIFSLGNGSSGESGPYMLRESRSGSGQNALRVFLVGNNNNSTRATSLDDTVPAGEWLLVWMRGDGQRIEAGIGGDVLVNSEISYTLESATESVSHAATYGEQANSSSRPRRMVGDMGNAIVHDTELSIDELQSLSEALL